MQVALIAVAAVVGIGVVLEVSLRSLFGFGDPLIYSADEEIGYLLAPNQQVRRFGNRIEINQYSMRTSAVSLPRPAATLRVLLLGDSIANGGWWTDQDQTISALLQKLLQAQSAIAPLPFNQVEILNASANSWGPRNELAYLKRFGQFEAQIIVLLVNTDDLFATAPTSVQVGRDRSYPNRKPPSALAELFTRHLLKPPTIPELEAVKAGGDRVGLNLEAIYQIHQIAVQNQGKCLLAITPLLRELGEPGPRDYEQKARQRLAEFAQTQQILHLDFLTLFNATPQPETLYRDHIHLSPAGDRLVSQTIAENLKLLLQGSSDERG